MAALGNEPIRQPDAWDRNVLAQAILLKLLERDQALAVACIRTQRAFALTTPKEFVNDAIELADEFIKAIWRKP